MKSKPTRSKVVIVGGGYGGVRAARQLSGLKDVEITLISKDENFAYFPQLYHAATGGSRSEASIPLNQLLSGKGVEVVCDTLVSLDAQTKRVTMASGQIYEYDQLILALGSVTNYFGITGLAENSFDIKTIEGAERFKHHLHDQLIHHNRPEIDYVIVGAGPTGIELAAALMDYLHRIVKLHGIRHGRYRIDLVEASPRILPRSSERYAKKVERRLNRLGIKIMTNTIVQQETADRLITKTSSIRTRTVVWTAGVANSPFFKNHNHVFTLTKNGKVEVDNHLEGSADIYLIGDNAATPYSGMAQTAIGDADFVARDITKKLSGRARPSYRPKSPASVIPVGAYWAAAQIGPFEFYGFTGWILRRLADFIGYYDIETLPQAVKVWLNETVVEDECKICEHSQPLRSVA